jgi:hypothetical protein
VQPSSLVFLILIAIWAAYLLQHWVRRREHLATARSVDRFSDAMRVLERRSPLPDFDLSVPRPRSYAISPARPSRPEVVVKRAHSVRPDVPTTPAAAVSDPPVRPTRVFRVLAGVSARRVRAVSLLTLLALALVVWPLAALSILPWWSVLAHVGALVADVTWLRHAAVAERAVGRAEAHARRSAAGPARAAARRSASFDAESELRVESEIESEIESEYDGEAAYDGEAPVAGARDVAQLIESPVEVDPSGWAPVPVPRPTYTLKAKAADPQPVPVPVPVPVPAPVTELAESECWSLDGMVYDCDLDELVERRSATGA